MNKLNKTRPNLSHEEFILILKHEGFDYRHIEVVYNEIQEYINIKNFAIYPEDDLRELYQLYDEEDVYLIDSICQKLNLRKPVQEDIDQVDNQFETFNARYILTLIQILAK